MKRLNNICFALVSLLLLTASTQAAVIRAGACNVRADLGLETPIGDYDVPPVTFGLGYFPRDNVEAGLLLGYRKLGWDSYWRNSGVWELGLFSEYHLDVNFPFHPLAGARLSVLDGDESSDTVGQLMLYGGAKYFLSEYVALAFHAGLALATEKIFDVTTHMRPDGIPYGEGDSFGFFFSLGLRFYY